MNLNYVIWLSSNFDMHTNAYGYWTGKNYVAGGELFPVTDSTITDKTKVYKSKKLAERGLKACLDRGYAYVVNGEVRELT